MIGAAQITILGSGSGGGAGSVNSFSTIQTPSGTSPVADSSADTLTLATANSNLTITGNAATDTITFAVLPSGSNTYVQYNNSGVFGASSNLTWNNSTGNLSVLGVLQLSKPGTGAVIVGDISGNARGSFAIDIQASRGLNTEIASALNSLCLGNSNFATNQFASAVGYSNNAAGDSSVCLGVSNATSSGSKGVCIGSNNTNNGSNTVLIGATNSTSSPNVISIGVNNTIGGVAALVVGFQNTTTVASASIFGSFSTNNTPNSLLIQQNNGTSFGNIGLAVDGGLVGVGTLAPLAHLEVTATTALVVPPYSSISAQLIQTQIGDDPGAASAVQNPGHLDAPGGFSASENLMGAGFTENGSTYEYRIWSYDGTMFSAPFSTSIFTDANGGLSFSVDLNWSAFSGAGTPTSYLIGRSINGGSFSYQNIPFAITTSFNDDNTGFIDSAPSPIYPDYVSNGTTRNYLAYSQFQEGTFYYNATPVSYNMTDNNNNTSYVVVHTISREPSQTSINTKVIGATDGVSANSSTTQPWNIPPSQSIFAEDSTTWTGDTVVTPISSGFLADGATLNRTISGYVHAQYQGLDYYSTAATSILTDPNDGRYYEISVNYTPSISTNAVDGLFIDSVINLGIFDNTGNVVEFATNQWTDTTNPSPTSLSLPSLKVTGPIVFETSGSVPGNPSTPVGWLTIIRSGQGFQVPFYL